jgi:5-methylcytosine-specific restriction protein A
MRPCLDCGTPSSNTRCPDHLRHAPKPSAASRGYDNQWTRLSRRARRLQPWCTDCGSTENLQTDHLPSAWERKAAGKTIGLTDVDVVCGDCNRRRGAARGNAPSARRQDPMGKAQFESHTRGSAA